MDWQDDGAGWQQLLCNVHCTARKHCCSQLITAHVSKKMPSYVPSCGSTSCHRPNTMRTPGFLSHPAAEVRTLPLCGQSA